MTIIRVKKRLKSIEKALVRTAQAKEEASRHQAVRHQADLLKSVLHTVKKGTREAIAYDWEQEMQAVSIPLDPTKEPRCTLEALYKKAAKLARAGPYLEEEEARLLKRKEQVATQLHVPPPQRKQEAIHLPYKRFVSSSGLPIWVGSSSHENHQLTFGTARADDVWLHAHQYQGAHVLIRCGKNRVVDEATLLEAGQLAVHYSKAVKHDGTPVEVLYAQKRFVSRMKGQPEGKVIVRAYKLMTICYDKQAIEAIRRLKRS